MKCTNCNGNVKVTDSVTIGNVVFRRRKCVECGKIIYTEESTSIRHQELKKRFWKVRRGEEEAE